jgi:tyrosyl-tRNA synthetase
MPSYELPPQVVMTTPLLEGLDGVEKMSKSLGNYVAVTEQPDEMFGKLMSIADDLMWRYYLLLTDLSPAEIDALKARVTDGATHPKQAKVDLARRIVSDFHSPEAATRAAESFEARFTRGEISVEELPVVPVAQVESSMAVSKVLVAAGLATSSSDATRKIQQGGVRVDREKVTDIKARLDPARSEILLQVGRRAVRVRLTPMES